MCRNWNLRSSFRRFSQLPTVPDLKKLHRMSEVLAYLGIMGAQLGATIKHFNTIVLWYVRKFSWGLSIVPHDAGSYFGKLYLIVVVFPVRRFGSFFKKSLQGLPPFNNDQKKVSSNMQNVLKRIQKSFRFFCFFTKFVFEVFQRKKYFSGLNRVENLFFWLFGTFIRGNWKKKISRKTS